MSDLNALLGRLIEASERLPSDDASPEDVLVAIEAMMDARKEAFGQLQAALRDGAEITAPMRAAAARLSELDRAWSTRVEAAMQAIAAQMRAHRRMRAAAREAPPTPTSQIQV